MGPRTHASYHDGKDIPLCVRFRIAPGSAPARGPTRFGRRRLSCPQPPPARVGEVARHVGVSERQLRNLFTMTLGVPPKRFARLSRVHTILDGAGRRSWSRLANDAGYYDQSPMTAEFREVMQVTPSVFAAGRLPIVSC